MADRSRCSQCKLVRTSCSKDDDAYIDLLQMRGHMAKSRSAADKPFVASGKLNNDGRGKFPAWLHAGD